MSDGFGPRHASGGSDPTSNELELHGTGRPSVTTSGTITHELVIDVGITNANDPINVVTLPA